ncbi:hypothetical protein [Sphingobacterium sp. UBA6320]|uniref:hypothetical protein n=1 Tax=Sphingobacterium sp. UBA6320 TaxID=1947510 RepID=UPI0025F81C76|nr:hypothetical protein [Sphingobacterium sp. UBA6320]
MNLIGKHSPVSIKYMQISNFLDTDEAPAFNFLFKVLTPVVSIIILSAVLYSFNMDKYTIDIYLISVYYVLFRWIFNIVIGRGKLLNWKKQFFYAAFIIGLSYFSYTNLIIHKKNLLPDFTTIANELWIIIMIFLYSLINNINISSLGSEKRKFKYISDVYNKFKRKYAITIDNVTNTNNVRLTQIIYAIIIHENFNRPKAYRLIEYLSGVINKKPKTYGVMQFKSDKPISDIASIELGSKKILNDFNALLPEYLIEVEEYKLKSEYWMHWLENGSLDNEYQRKLIRNYNHCDDYTYEIIELADYLNEKFYDNKEINKKLFSSI